MEATTVKRKKVEELSQYGKPLRSPKETAKKAMAIFFSELRHKFGLLGLIPFFVKVLVERGRLKKRHPEAIKLAQKLGPETANEFVLMASMFNVIAKKDGREQAYQFLKGMVQKVGPYGIPAMYQVDELVECEGDVFDNFKKFHTAMFQTMYEEGTWQYGEMIDEKDKHMLKIVSCINVDIFGALGCPELGKLGCDHDLTGYPAIEDRVQAEFRRPCTIAKGGSYCKFIFYRQGTAPETEEVDGKMVKWEPHLNK
jgi:hypothetical protein